MKKLLAVAGLVAVVGMSAAVFADEKAKTETVTGEVVDLACYLDHGAKGEKHAKCAEHCISGGMPVGVLTDDGKLFLVIGAKHKALNKDLAQYAAKKITVTGTVGTQNGVSLITVEKYEAAK